MSRTMFDAKKMLNKYLLNKWMYTFSKQQPIIFCHFIDLIAKCDFISPTDLKSYTNRFHLPQVFNLTLLFPPKLDGLTFCFSHVPKLLRLLGLCSSWPHCLESSPVDLCQYVFVQILAEMSPV